MSRASKRARQLKLAVETKDDDVEMLSSFDALCEIGRANIRRQLRELTSHTRSYAEVMVTIAVPYKPQGQNGRNWADVADTIVSNTAKLKDLATTNSLAKAVLDDQLRALSALTLKDIISGYGEKAIVPWEKLIRGIAVFATLEECFVEQLNDTIALWAAAEKTLNAARTLESALVAALK